MRLFTYDTANNLTQGVDEAGGTVQYSYDNANELQSVVHANAPDPTHNTTAYQYDQNGKLHRADES